MTAQWDRVCSLSAPTLLLLAALHAVPAKAQGPPQAAGETTILQVKIILEAGDTTPLSLKLRGVHDETIKTWEGLPPGDLRLEVPKLEPAPESYLLLATAKGYILRYTRIFVSNDGVRLSPDTLQLSRLRYAVIKYDVNLKGQRALTGPDVKHFRVAVTSGQMLPELIHDFMMRQSGDGDLMFGFHRIGGPFGMAPVPPGKTFEELTEAPPPEQYSTTDVVCKRGLLLYSRVIGHQKDMERYAKILVEDVTEKPPTDVQFVELRSGFWKDKPYNAVKPARDEMNREHNRMWAESQKFDKEQQALFSNARAAIQKEARRRFPGDELAYRTWYLDQTRGKRVEELPAVLEALRQASVRDGTAPKQIDLSGSGPPTEVDKVLAAIRSNEAKIKNAEWHIVYTAGVVDRPQEPSSYTPDMMTRVEGTVRYDYERDHYWVELSGIRPWPKTTYAMKTPYLQWKHTYAYNGVEMRTLREDGPPDFNSPQAEIARDAASLENYAVVADAVLTRGGVKHFLVASPGNSQGLPVVRLSTEVQEKKLLGQIEVRSRQNGVWMITDKQTPLRMAYDPQRGALLGVQFLASSSPLTVVNPGSGSSANVLKLSSGSSANPTQNTQGGDPTKQSNQTSTQTSAATLEGILKIELQQVGEFWAPKTVLRANSTPVPAAQRFDFSDVKINQTLPATAFTLAYAPYTHVNDRIRKTSYMSGTAAAPAVAATPPPPPADPAPQAPASHPTWISFALASIIAVLIGVIVVIRRRDRE